MELLLSTFVFNCALLATFPLALLALHYTHVDAVVAKLLRCRCACACDFVRRFCTRRGRACIRGRAPPSSCAPHPSHHSSTLLTYTTVVYFVRILLPHHLTRSSPLASSVSLMHTSSAGCRARLGGSQGTLQHRCSAWPSSSRASAVRSPPRCSSGTSSACAPSFAVLRSTLHRMNSVTASRDSCLFCLFSLRYLSNFAAGVTRVRCTIEFNAAVLHNCTIACNAIPQVPRGTMQ